jgi:hypothetical protein
MYEGVLRPWRLDGWVCEASAAQLMVLYSSIARVVQQADALPPNERPRNRIQDNALRAVLNSGSDNISIRLRDIIQGIIDTEGAFVVDLAGPRAARKTNRTVQRRVEREESAERQEDSEGTEEGQRVGGEPDGKCACPLRQP